MKFNKIIKTLKKQTLSTIPKDKLHYLASPYSSEDSLVLELRYILTIYTASKLTLKGYRLLEPIAMCHEQSSKFNMPGGYTFWQTRDRGFIDKSDSLIVLTLKGWKQSTGVRDEVEYAHAQGKPIYLLDPIKLSKTEINKVI